MAFVGLALQSIKTLISLQGFFLTVSPETIQTVAKHAHENNKIFLMNLSAPFLCEFYKEPMLAALPYVDILFGNEIEAAAFAKHNNLQSTDLKEIALEISNMDKINTKRKRIVIITQGVDPVLLAMEGTVTEYPAHKISDDKIVDTNGAGDAFVGGILYYFVVTYLEKKIKTVGLIFYICFL